MIFILCYLFIIYAIIEHYSHGMRFLEFVSSFGSSMKNRITDFDHSLNCK